MKEFDKIIKDKLSDIDSPYAPDTWASIQKALPQKKKRPYGLFFMSFVFIVLLSLPVIAYINKKVAVTPAKSSQSTAAFEQMANNFDEKQSIAATQPSINEQATVQSESVTSNQQLALHQNNSNSKKISHSSTSNNNKSNQSETNINDKINTLYTSPNPMSNETSVSVAQINPTMVYTAAADEQIEGQVSKRQNYVNIAKITLPSTGRVFGTDQSHLFESVQMSMKKNASLPCPTFVKKQNLSFIEFYFANDYGIRNMSLKNSDKTSYMDKRNNTEFPFFSYSAGTRVGIGWESGIAFKSGLDYTQINEKFIYTDPNSIQKKTITLIKYIYDSNFNVIDSTKTVEEVEIPGSNKIVNYNKYRFVDIPVLFQYTIPGKKRLSYSITAGPYINISFTQSGKILSEDNKNLLEISNKKLYKDNIGLSLYTALAINYQLTKTTQIVFEPNIRYIPNSISQLQNPIDQKYLIASIAAGFRYKI
jgi:hypothetical protein